MSKYITTEITANFIFPIFASAALTVIGPSCNDLSNAPGFGQNHFPRMGHYSDTGCITALDAGQATPFRKKISRKEAIELAHQSRLNFEACLVQEVMKDGQRQASWEDA